MSHQSPLGLGLNLGQEVGDEIEKSSASELQLELIAAVLSVFTEWIQYFSSKNRVNKKSSIYIYISTYSQGFQYNRIKLSESIPIVQL